ncbi:MAG TPA: TIGR03435 family protein [Vicinamibacterales bacterium]|nr:TIGR03435 family protein [Vicinamibacterales bacterium]
MRVVETRTTTIIDWRVLIVAASLAAISPPVIGAQGTAERETFETASIRENRSGSTARHLIKPQPSGLTVTNATVLNLIAYAFSVNERDVVGDVPGWVRTSKFDVAARAADGPLTHRRVQSMTKALLQARFELDASYERAVGPVYALVAARSDGTRGPNLRPSESKCAADPPLRADAEPAMVRSLSFGERCGISIVTNADGGALIALSGRRLTMQQLATQLSWVGVFDRRVVDRTGLSGEFDFRATPPPDMVAPSSEARLLTAMREQLGLTLRAEEASYDVLRIRRIQPPSPN